MYQVEDEPIETIHLYVVREGDKRPSLIPVIISVFALSILIAIGVSTPYKQPEQRAFIRVPAVLLPVRVFSAQIAIIPTGIRTYPATFAHGTLTITNGSVIAQELPPGMTFTSNSGISVTTDAAVFVPAGSANGYGYATTTAHVSRVGINLPTLSINQVVGTSLFVRNLSAFTGGKPAYSVSFVTEQDRVRTIVKARSAIARQLAGLHYPCKESYFSDDHKVTLSWRCQFVTYSVPSYMRVISVTIQGKDLLLVVVFVARPRLFWAK